MEVNTFQNQDKVLKESLSLFKGGSLEFLDSELVGEITEILNTEITETTTKKAFADNALKLSTNKGLHTEWQVRVEDDDIMRIASYNIDLSRMHKMPFTTVIITTKDTSVKGYSNPSLTFTPKIINLKERDADMALAEIDKKLEAGEYNSINLLEIVYLPLYGSKSGKNMLSLLDTAIKLAPKVANSNKQKQRKLHDLLILLTSSFISDNELSKIVEANMRVLEDSPAVRVFQELFESRGIAQGIAQGVAQGIAQVAINMLQYGDDIDKVSTVTGLEPEKVKLLQSELST